MKDCHECKKLTRYALLEFARTCKGYPDYDEIVFCPNQIEYILQHSELLHEGRKPIAESSYTDAPSSGKGRKSDATRTQDIIIEVERRLEHCGLDGLMVILYHKNGYDERFLSRYYWIHEAEIRRMIEATILHISGHSYKESFKYNRYRAMRDYFRWQRRGQNEG